MSRKQNKKCENVTERMDLLKFNEQQRNMKPGVCNKFMHAVIDPEFLQGEHGTEVLSKINELNLKYEIQQQQFQRVITFYRTNQLTLTAQTAIIAKTTAQKFIVHLMTGQELVQHVKEGTLLSIVLRLSTLYPDTVVSLLVYGLVSYCRSNRNCVGRRETETALTEVQLFTKCSYQLLDTAEEVGNFVAQLGKSLAELPYKQQQYNKYSQEQLYLGNEKKGCVSAGIHQMYQNMLVKIPSVSLEVAEAIISVYPSLSQLMDGFRFAADGPNLLADIPIRRAGGPVTTSIRRIGPEMSKKIYLLFSSLDPNKEL